jgi:LacI family transcriptional regulator
MARRRQTVTIKHVAADAGVSLQTVSRVINNEPNVRPEMQERVREAIARLGYVPSIAAQRMSGSRSYLILALNDRDRTIADWRARQGSDWVDQMLLGGMLQCAEHGYRMILNWSIPTTTMSSANCLPPSPRCNPMAWCSPRRIPTIR